MLQMKFKIHGCSDLRVINKSMDLNARVDVNCGRKDGRTENRKPISHLAKAGATKKNIQICGESVFMRTGVKM